MIDTDGFRPCVGIVVINSKKQLLWARRTHQNSWQFPQGGLKNNESPEDAMYRELHEEIGLRKNDVKLIYTSDKWYKYKLPKRLVRINEDPICMGQKQKWFLLKLLDEKNSKLFFDSQQKPEFDNVIWVNYWYPIRQVVSFKRDVYRKVLTEFSKILYKKQY